MTQPTNPEACHYCEDILRPDELNHCCICGEFFCWVCFEDDACIGCAEEEEKVSHD